MALRLSSLTLASASPWSAARRPAVGSRHQSAPAATAKCGDCRAIRAGNGRQPAPRTMPEAREALHDRSIRPCASASSQGVSPGGDNGDEEPMVIMSGVSYHPSGEEVQSDTTASGTASETASATAVLEGPAPVDVDKLQMRLLSFVSGLDRGIAAFPLQQKEVDALSLALERSQEKPPRLAYPDGGGMDLLNGKWRLVYSSGFGSGSLGGRRPGPPASIVPFSIGQVFQDINTFTMELDNIVELCFRTPALPFAQEDPEPTILEINLGHLFQVMDRNRVRIVFETTEVTTRSPLPFLESIPKFSTPMLPENLRPPQDIRAATFDVTFLDETLRITRGDRGELRIYTRA